jgi:hypothetical protein
MSEQTKHTPGPWKAQEDLPNKLGREFNIYIGTNYKPGGLCDGSRTIAKICGLAITKPGALEVNRANAKLIAAAPDLLAALIECEKLLRLGYSEKFTEQECERTCPQLKLVRQAIKKATK